MSEKFTMQVLFSFESDTSMGTLQTIIEHLDMYEYEEAIKLISHHDLNCAMAQFTAITSEHCQYTGSDDLLTMYTECFDANIDDLELVADDNKFSGKIIVSGQDHTALDFCGALILLLLSLNARISNAQAHCDYWHAHWTKENTGPLKLTIDISEPD